MLRHIEFKKLAAAYTAIKWQGLGIVEQKEGHLPVEESRFQSSALFLLPVTSLAGHRHFDSEAWLKGDVFLLALGKFSNF